MKKNNNKNNIRNNNMNDIIKHEEQKKDLDLFRTLAQTAMKSGQYGAMNEATILNIMLTAKDLGISPMKALNGGFYIVNGKISMSTAIMADRIRSAGHSVKILETTNQKCTILGVRKDNGDSCKLEYTMEDAQLAGLSNSPTWKKFPRNMLYNRCMSMIARMLFPDVVGNAYSEDEAHDIKKIPPSERPVEDPFTGQTIDMSTGEIEQPVFTISDLMNKIQDQDISQQDAEDFLKYISVRTSKPYGYCLEQAIENSESFVEKLLSAKNKTKKSKE